MRDGACRAYKPVVLPAAYEETTIGHLSFAIALDESSYFALCLRHSVAYAPHAVRLITDDVRYCCHVRRYGPRVSTVGYFIFHLALTKFTAFMTGDCNFMNVNRVFAGFYFCHTI